MRLVQVPLEDRTYPIYIGRNIYTELAGIWAASIQPSGVLLISDDNVFPLLGDKFISLLEKAGWSVSSAVVPAGEESKALVHANTLYTKAIEIGLDRRGLIVALGGGVIGDLAGFVASTYLRGVPYIQVPTTLLAQVDSSVGGKVAVNHQSGKNLIGSFHQPKLVWAELETLDTLPEREFLAGISEVIKYGAILSESFFSYLETNWDNFLLRKTAVLSEIIASCCSLKARVVAEDEREDGLRAILNFGHTLGHALETATCYQYYLHGEAVLPGMMMAARIAAAIGLCSDGDARRLLDLCNRVGVRLPPPTLQIDSVLQALIHDKKREDEDTVFILPLRIGEVEKRTGVNPELIRDVVIEYFSGKLQNVQG